MGRLTRSWGIFRKSLSLIGAEKKLLIFPLISFTIMVALLALVVSGTVMYVIGSGDAAPVAASSDEQSLNPVFFGAYFLVYLLFMFMANFCLTAFFSEIIRGLRGEPVAVGRGFVFAAGRVKAIFLWSLFASVIGVILRMLEEKAGLIGRIVINLIGMAWAVASCFAVPALVCDPELNNPVEALRRSATAIKRTWGESLAGFAGIQIITLLAGALWLAASLAILVVCLPEPGLRIFGFAVLGLLFLAFMAFCYVVGVAQHIYQAALYLYAENGDAGIFSEEEIAGAFKVRRG